MIENNFIEEEDRQKMIARFARALGRDRKMRQPVLEICTIANARTC